MNNQSVSFIVIYFVVPITPSEVSDFIQQYLSSVQSQDNITDEASDEVNSGALLYPAADGVPVNHRWPINFFEVENRSFVDGYPPVLDSVNHIIEQDIKKGAMSYQAHYPYYQDGVIFSSDPNDSGRLFLVKHRDFSSLFRVLLAKKNNENIELLNELCPPQEPVIVKCWDVGCVNFTYDVYQSVLQTICTSPFCSVVENNFFYCNEHDNLIRMIEEAICNKRMNYFFT